MKKHISLIIALTVVLSLTGCAKSDAEILSSAAAGEYYPTDIGGSYSERGDSYHYAADAEEEMMLEAIADTTTKADPSDGEIFMPDVPDDKYNEPIQPAAGLLTGGEWRDNDHWADWNALYSSHPEWNSYKKEWNIQADQRITVTVTSNGLPVEGASVSACGWNAVTDNKGKAYTFFKETDDHDNVTLTVSYGDTVYTEEFPLSDGEHFYDVELENIQPTSEKKLDLLIMCDTTGSMGDELEFLKTELRDIIATIKQDNANIPTRLSVNFYRDEGDDYIVRQYPFTTHVEDAYSAISEQYASGGGDFPEAVHSALKSAISDHEWDNDAVKLMFLVLDAPPHSDNQQIVDEVSQYIALAAEKGIRIIPIASSGVDKTTEYLLRTMAFYTGGTYTFLTDDSGIGGSHIQPTVGAYNVERLNDMMVRIVNGYLN